MEINGLKFLKSDPMFIRELNFIGDDYLVSERLNVRFDFFFFFFANEKV